MTPSTTPSPVARAAGALSLDLDELRTLTEQVLNEPLYWYPVRHHSPTVARALERVIAQRKPKVIFLEAPADVQDLIRFVQDSKTQPPVAIYCSYRDDDNVLNLAGIASPAPDIPSRFSCFYPLMACSPEYATIQAAAKVKSRIVCMDLPQHAILRPREEPATPPTTPTPAPATPPVTPTPPRPARPEMRGPGDERLITRSSFYRALAEAAGYRSWDEAWDTLFELRPEDEDPECLRYDLALFCAASRATTDPERIANDDTRPRERFMLRTIRETLARDGIRPQDAMVVCGGFHLFLDRDDPTDPPTPPAGTVFNTIVPYSYYRMSDLSGYGAGNRAPQFYQLSYDMAKGKRLEELPVEFTVQVLRQTRKAGSHVSSADAIAVSQHARMLGRLRGRMRPVLDDLRDALITCCVKGDPKEQGRHLLAAFDKAAIGTKLGKVTDAIGRLPLLSDFHTQISDLDLGELFEREGKLRLDLDRREPRDHRRSVFLQRVRYLDVGVCTLTERPSSEVEGGMIFREGWDVAWSPNVEPKLIELNLYGDTVEAAALARLREQIAQDGLQADLACRHLVQSIDMDFANLVQEVEEICSQAIDQDGRFISLASALSSLSLLDRYAVYRGLRRDVLGCLMDRCFDRACFALLDAASAPDDQHPAVVNGMLVLAEVVQRSDRPGIDRDLFAEQVRIAAENSTVPFLRGAFLGLLTELRTRTAEELAADVSCLARAPTERMVTAGDFVDGILAVSRTAIMLGADSLIAALDELLRAAEWETFLTMLPRLRGAFERLHERQRDSLAENVARRYGLCQAEEVTDLRTSVGAAARIAAIDRRVAEILARWEF
jgi:hypothetical protein